MHLSVGWKKSIDCQPEKLLVSCKKSQVIAKKCFGIFRSSDTFRVNLALSRLPTGCERHRDRSVDEIQGTYRGMMIAIPSPNWQVFEIYSAEQLTIVLQQLAGEVQSRTVCGQ